jgi:DNA-binding winged helix-turn-helix (wHTH) protein
LCQKGLWKLLQKHDLMKEVWPDAIVEEANLARNIWTLRKALGDGNGADMYMETIPKLGYRFVARVTELPALENGSGIQRTPEKPIVKAEEDDKPRKLPLATLSAINHRRWVPVPERRRHGSRSSDPQHR